MSISNKPETKIDDVLKEIIPSVRESLHSRLNDIKSTLITIEEDYEDKGENMQLHMSVSASMVGAVTADELVHLYERKLVAKKSKSRHFYDEILALNSLKMCPYCNTKDSTTLDHYLPKANYPQYAITPLNLVPACRDCNHKKRDDIPQCATDLFLHPYFEDLPDFVWLNADVQQTNPVSFKFDISSASEGSKKIILHRLKKQFNCLDLASVYGTYSANEWSSIKYYISNLPDCNAISQYITSTLHAAEHHNINSWKAAMYRGMLRSSWILNKEFLNT